MSIRPQISYFALAVALGLGVGAGPALAADFTIDTPTVVTYNLNSGDTLAITGLGSITTSGANKHGVNLVIDPNVTIVNDGAITTSGAGANGIYASKSDHLSVTNNGTIATSSGAGSNGILIQESSDSTLINNGTITIAYDGSKAISVETSDRTSAVNFGNIEVMGASGRGMLSNYSDDATLTNYGTILATGPGGGGMVVANGTGLALTNFGTVTTGVNAGDGLVAYDVTDTLVSNVGSVRVKGVDLYGIGIYDASTGVTVANTGSVISEQSYAIYLGGDVFDSQLNLSTLGHIGGRIGFVEPTTINITTDSKAHSVLWDLSDGVMVGDAPVVTGDAPWFYNSTTKQFATYDASILAGALDELGDVTDMLSDVGAGTSGRKGLWLTGIGGQSMHAGDGTTPGRTIQQYGIALGYTGDVDDETQWSLAGGYLRSNNGLDGDASAQNASNILFATANGARSFGVITIDGGVSGGLTGQQSSRFINDNLALTNGLTLGEGTADAASVGVFLAPEIGISAALEANGWTLTPAARLRYSAQWMGSSTETGSAANAVVDGMMMGLLEANAELGLSRDLGFGAVSTRIGYQIRQAMGDNSADVTLLGVTNAIELGGGNSQTVYAGLDLALEPSSNVRLTLDAMGYIGYELTGGRASADFAVAF